MNRTLKIQLHPTPEQAVALRETLTQFTQVFNHVCRYGWEHRERNGVSLHHATYYETKALYPSLVSDLLICKSCGYCLNAYLNAAVNIREKYATSHAQDGTSILSGHPVKMPIVSTGNSQGQASCI